MSSILFRNTVHAMISYCRLFVFPLLATTLMLGACQQPSTSDVDHTDEGVLRLGTVAVVDTVSRAVAPNDRPLVIDGFRGSVDLKGSDGSTAELQFVRQGRGQSREAARGVLDDVTITESGSEQSYSYTLETDGGAYAAVDVLGTVPRTADLRVEQSKGPVSLSGVQGALTVAHDHGPVTIQGASASVDVKVKNGDLQVDLQSLPSDATIALRTANGDVTLGVPPTASAQFEVQTNVGVIQTKGLSLAEERFMPRDAGGQYTARMGTGDASIEVQVQNGSILVQSTNVPERERPVRVDTAATESVPADSVSDGSTTPAPNAAGSSASGDTLSGSGSGASVSQDTVPSSSTPTPDTGAGR